VAVVRNITNDDLSLSIPNAPVARAGKEAEVPDAAFVDRAWPKSTWTLVKKPGKDYIDASTDDAVLFVTEPDETVADLKAQAEAQGVDITGLTKKADIAAALAAGPTPEESA
jgi:hypothetical protein